MQQQLRRYMIVVAVSTASLLAILSYTQHWRLMLSSDKVYQQPRHVYLPRISQTGNGNLKFSPSVSQTGSVFQRPSHIQGAGVSKGGNRHLANDGNDGLATGGNEHFQNDGNGHLLSNGNDHLPNDGNDHLLNDDNGHLLNDGNDHLLNDGKDHILNDGNDHLLNDGNGRLLNNGNDYLQHNGNDHILNGGNNHLLNDGNDHLLNNGKDHLLNNGNDHILNDGNDHLLNGGIDRLLNNGKEHLLNDGKDHILNEGKDHILTDGKDHILNDGKDHILTDGKDHVLNDGKDHLLNDGKDHSTFHDSVSRHSHLNSAHPSGSDEFSAANSDKNVELPHSDKGADENAAPFKSSFAELQKDNRPAQTAAVSSATDRAVCVGSDRRRGEVEDILCWPKPNYDPAFKNPCWLDNRTRLPSAVLSASRSRLRHPAGILYCLPYFHILGTSKAGTTDFYRRLSLHRDIVPNSGIFGKERLFWSWSKYGYSYRNRGTHNTQFRDYIRGFSPIASSLKLAGPHKRARLVTLDGSPPDMWDFRGWNLLPQNRGLREPAVLTPHLMKHVYRDPKFIVLLREPVERLYTAYFFHKMGYSAQEFHNDVLRSIAKFEFCLRTAPSKRECYFNASVLNEMNVEIGFACPSVYIKEWFAVFPRNRFLFMRTESYIENVKQHLQTVFKFLELAPPKISTLNQMLEAPVSYHTQLKDMVGPMFRQTRELLHKYVQPCNEELAHLLEDQQYLWKDVYSSWVSSNFTG